MQSLAPSREPFFIDGDWVHIVVARLCLSLLFSDKGGSMLREIPFMLPHVLERYPACKSLICRAV